jgi:DNA-binding NarL/FixJ family response regulator
MAKIVLVDDHKIIIDLLQLIIERDNKHTVVAKFLNASDFLKAFKNDSDSFEVLLLDIKLPDGSGIDIAKKVKEVNPDIKIIILSQYKCKEYVFSGLKIGVQAYLLKDCSAEELLMAIDRVLKNQIYLCAEIAKIEANKELQQYAIIYLTEREREVLQLVVNGFSNKEIAQKLFIEADSVEFHKKNLKQKLNVNKSIELAVKAIELGFVNLN